MVVAGDSIKPFLRWAGGKSWLVTSGVQVCPNEYKVYREPFLGGAAVFLDEKPDRFVISDTNADLVCTYKAIRNRRRAFVEAFENLAKRHSKDFYYEVRASSPSTSLERAARFLYLNRTCFNGLYRVNRSGGFNVPIGDTKATSLLCGDFLEISKLLRRGTVRHGDFEESINEAKNGDFLFVDPPYTVKHNRNGFVEYNEKIFSWDDQLRLRNALQRAADRGVLATVTNANHQSVLALYQGMGEIIEIERSSSIAGSVSSRGVTTEMFLRIGWNGSPIERTFTNAHSSFQERLL